MSRKKSRVNWKLIALLGGLFFGTISVFAVISSGQKVVVMQQTIDTYKKEIGRLKVENMTLNREVARRQQGLLEMEERIDALRASLQEARIKDKDNLKKLRAECAGVVLVFNDVLDFLEVLDKDYDGNYRKSEKELYQIRQIRQKLDKLKPISLEESTNAVSD